MLSEEQREKLLEIGRRSIESYLKEKKLPQPSETDAELSKEKGAFVTITKNGELRGCIGYVEPTKPLYQTVGEMAVQAAVGDPRFAPLTEEELGHIRLEISVLSPLKEMEDISQIEVGTHGLVIKKGFNSGLLLPQVATEYGWNREEFLANTCYKAGLSPDAWKKDAEIYIFSAEVFGEKQA